MQAIEAALREKQEEATRLCSQLAAARARGESVRTAHAAKISKLAAKEAQAVKPYTLHPTPYTLNPTPYTLNPKP